MKRSGAPSCITNKMEKSQLQISALSGELKYFRVPGPTVENADQNCKWNQLLAFRPTQVIMHLGGNSTNTAANKVERIWNKLTDLRQQLLDSGVRRVFVGQILPMGCVSRFLDPYLTVAKFEELRVQ